MDGPVLNYRPPPMPAIEQVESAAEQLEGTRRHLEGATWVIHPTDLVELGTVIGDELHLHGRFFTITADPELVGMGPRLIWPDERPEEWGAVPNRDGDAILAVRYMVTLSSGPRPPRGLSS